MNKQLTFLLSLTFLFLFSGSVYGDDFQDGMDAYKRKDYKEAFRLWKQLAEQGNVEAQYNLGVIYYHGQEVPQDYKEAVRWFRLSAEQGNADAQTDLGSMYANGTGVLQDYKEAVKWYRLAAEQGDALAHFNLGSMYHEGQGVPQDYKEAVKWYRLSAEQGYAQAQKELGLLYFKGEGVLQDYALAHMWFNICAAGEKDDWKEDCMEARTRVQRKMTPQQIEKAQEMARNWKPKQERSLFEKFKENFGIK